MTSGLNEAAKTRAELGIPLQSYLLASDFDGTQFDTSEPAPGGLGVNEAYFEGIKEELGEDAAWAFHEQGGHNHRSPTEIVKSVRPDLSGDDLQRVTVRVIENKLDILIAQIGQELPDGSPWPRPTDGFVDLWRRVYAAREVGRSIGTAVVSNGHTRFEIQVLEMLGLPQPDIFITDDVLRSMALQLPLERQVKPAALMLRMAQDFWRYRLALARTAANNPRIPYKPPQIATIYIGDDPVKDKQMAESAEAEFVLLEAAGSQEAWRRVGAYLGLGQLSLSRTISP